MDQETISAFDATRNLSNQAFLSGCYAPYTSLYFDTSGDVRVCCHNWSNIVGNVTRNSLDEIWKGTAIAAIRSAVKRLDFKRGCQFCEWHLSTRQFLHAPITKWDKFTVTSETPEWPKLMEFSISNQCNLECVMCDGKSSSAIRQRREKLPPIPRVYGDKFFEELRSYLPHLQQAKFLGGEPFLQTECFRVWEMLLEERIRLPVTVTTNGTHYNSQVERVLDSMPVGIVVSLDAMSKETYEDIRVNADHGKVMENVRRFRSYSRLNKTTFGLTYCLMRRNWQEFADFCVFCEQMECVVWVNIVRRPPHLSLYTLDADDLSQIVDIMEKQGHMLKLAMGGNYPVWENEIDRLRKRCLGVIPPNVQVIQGAAIQ
ncbi:radical SAM protein [Granulicella aggregans]|uniref:radical SAM protein n=1 Tax=Granulicella aggregans TaxID=474949 RepID=UPI0021DFC1B7|nr:radical SAM protein [Granulicella aggregans]